MADIAIPVIDLTAWPDGAAPPAELAGDVSVALREVGFFVLTGHGVAETLIADTFAQCARFHAQPLAAKQRLRLDRNNNGFMAAKSTTIRTSELSRNERYDLNEAFFFRPELAPDHPDVLAGRQYRGLNRWPDGLPGFRETALAYAEAMLALARRLQQLLAVALELPADWFDAVTGEPQFVVRLSHYPPAAGPRDRYGLSPHTDASFFTLLPQTEVPGLEIRLPDGDWHAPPFLPGSIVFNSGDMLHRWSNGRLLSTPHRALPPVGRERYAIPFFYGPDWDAEIACLPTCLGPGESPRWPPITYADYMTWWYEQNYASAHTAADARA
jgi:isopenicillin N synthase-like dioxygenase